MTQHSKQSLNSQTNGIKPPLTSIGVIGWIKSNLFNGIFNSVLTLLMLFFLWKILPPLIRWIFIDSLWTSTSAECRSVNGACWSIVSANYRFILFGFFPHDMQWRPLLAMILLITLLLISRNRKFWKPFLLYAWIAGLSGMAILMKGGVLGLAPVESTQWGGLPLTFLLAVFGLTAAYPLGVLLALGRRSKMPAIKMLSIVYIEMIRGVPLVSLLFMSAVIFPLFLPEGITINKILRAQVAIIAFTAAYIAEVVRGGLQGVASGQYEAPETIGSSNFLMKSPPAITEPWFFYGNYYYAQSMYQRGGDYAATARRKTEDTLLKNQAADGSWMPRNGNEKSAGPVYATSLALLSLSVYHHFLPIYQK